MKITVLDADTVGRDLDLSPLSAVGEYEAYPQTPHEMIPERIKDSDIVMINKAKMTADVLTGAEKLKLICIAATGYDNIDTAYCREHGIAVCNVAGYSTQSVAQLTVAMALSLYNRLEEYTGKVRSGEYSRGNSANILEPVYHEICGKTWGIIGYGNIGKQVGKVAEALGCRVIYNRRSAGDGVTLDRLMKDSDRLSGHTPLNDSTRGLVSREMIGLMKSDAILINVARGAVCDEAALAEAVGNGMIGGIGVDVYSKEPFPSEHPFAKLAGMPNVILTPHMAWGSYEARVRCLDEIVMNIKSFCEGGKRNRVV